jgi:hypothetical protein
MQTALSIGHFFGSTAGFVTLGLIIGWVIFVVIKSK